jgi:hypothetical protein
MLPSPQINDQLVFQHDQFASLPVSNADRWSQDDERRMNNDDSIKTVNCHCRF